MNRRLGALVSVALIVPVFLSAQKQTKLLFVNAVDWAGAPVRDLTAPDFDVSVGGVKQTVTRAIFGEPMRIVLLVDASAPVEPMVTRFRAGLNAFMDTLPPDAEVALITCGEQIRVRQAPTTDRTKLHAAADGFASQGGNNAFLDVLLETDKRFLKNAPDRWPVFVILSTDLGGMTGAPNIESFNAFVKNFRVRGGSAHAIIVQGQNTGLISDLAQNLVQNTGGVYDPIAISNALPEKMKALAARLAADHQAMANRYAVEYAGDAKATQAVEVKVQRDGVTVQGSPTRPF